MKTSLILALVALLALAGCARKEAHHDPAHAAGHHHHAPHGGVLVELGGHQYNLEIAFDARRGVLQAWVLDAHAENFVRIKAAGFEMEAAMPGGGVRLVDFVAVADTMTGETVGDTALFEAPAEWLRVANAFDGKIKAITVRGSTFNDVAFHFDSDHAEPDHQH